MSSGTARVKEWSGEVPGRHDLHMAAFSEPRSHGLLTSYQLCLALTKNNGSATKSCVATFDWYLKSFNCVLDYSALRMDYPTFISLFFRNSSCVHLHPPGFSIRIVWWYYCRPHETATNQRSAEHMFVLVVADGSLRDELNSPNAYRPLFFACF